MINVHHFSVAIEKLEKKSNLLTNQSSGFLASGSGILALSSQSSGFVSSGSSISAGGTTEGLKQIFHVASIKQIRR